MTKVKDYFDVTIRRRPPRLKFRVEFDDEAIIFDDTCKEDVRMLKEILLQIIDEI